MAGTDAHELLTDTFGEVAGLAQHHGEELERLKNEIGFDNLSPIEKAHMITVAEILGEVIIVSSIAHEKSTATQAAL
jgi:hypothetical protein